MANRLTSFFANMLAPSYPVHYSLTIEEIRSFELTTLELMLPTIIGEFNSNPFACNALIFKNMEAMLDRHREIRGIEYRLVGEGERVIWPTPEGLKILARLNERYAR